MKLYPQSAETQLEFDKIKNILAGLCATLYGRQKATHLRIHTQIDYIQTALQQTHELKTLQQTGLAMHNDFSVTMDKELKLLGIPGAVLATEDFVLVSRLCDAIQQIFRWFDADRRQAYPALTQVVAHAYYEKQITAHIQLIIDDAGLVKDNASADLQKIRMALYKKRGELRRLFDRIVQKMNKQGYLADMEESFMNGRRVLAVFAENKRMIHGVMHGESDSRQTAYIEPEETTAISNEIYSLENDERKEIYRILRQLTADLHPYADLLKSYLNILGELDFIRAKAKLALQMNGHYPTVVNKAHIALEQAYHPLLYLYNLQNGKPVCPVGLTLDDAKRILIISGPNAGGKTVTMKTVGLLQVMLQSGLLVPVHPNSVMGVFRQLFIHIGDTQSIEFELSTYSSHLQHMKYFLETANGKTLFFIDELGSGSDPNMGGAFAEAIMEELHKKHAMGIVTTHYLNLKLMAGKVAGIINGAMLFDEQKLMPLYKLIVGKPGSSYTFSIAERIGLPKHLIHRAKNIIDDGHFKLDKLLSHTEQGLQKIDEEAGLLKKLIKENELLKKEMQQTINTERHRQQVELLSQQNKLKEDQLAYLKDMDRKLKTLVIEWRQSTNKADVVQRIHTLLFNQKEKQVAAKHEKKLDGKYIILSGDVRPGDKVKMKQNKQIGTVKEIRGKKVIVQVGAIPITVDAEDVVKVVEKPVEG